MRSSLEIWLDDPPAQARRAFRLTLFATAIFLLGLLCAPPVRAAPPPTAVTAAPHTSVDDPWETANRKRYASHERLDRALIRPAAIAYHAVTPGPIGKAIHNVLTNLSEPLVLANDLLQLRFKRGGVTLLRIVANTTAGWGGLMDVAGGAGLPHHHNSFGTTLGRYGVGPGPYVYAPIVGPSTVRDLFGEVVDAIADPMRLVSYPHRTAVDAGLAVVGGLDMRVQSDEDLTTLLADAADPYATLRSVYLQDRQAEVEGRDTPATTLPEIESEPAATPPTDTPSPPSSETPGAPTADVPPPPAPSASLAPPPAGVELAADDAPLVSAGADARAPARPSAVFVEAGL